MKVGDLAFDWDDGNRQKCEQHGLSVLEIESVFQGPLSVFPDPAHSGEEERFIGIGTSGQGRSVFVVFTLRKRAEDSVLVRPISARYMHKKEIDHYEKEASKVEKRRGG
ncbi:MAG: BrnT family toxin [Methyloceanibacter sp.]|uniref:BrnT family toxin n=1 Tax=Methyloceanibacter sp. TaxID=1965321 RepID=UPI003D6D9A37